MLRRLWNSSAICGMDGARDLNGHRFRNLRCSIDQHLHKNRFCPSRPNLRLIVRFFRQGPPLRSSERHTPAPLTEGRTGAFPRRNGHLLFIAPLRNACEVKTKIQKQEILLQQTERKPLFDLGQLVATPGALIALGQIRTERDGLAFAPCHG